MKQHTLINEVNTNINVYHEHIENAIESHSRKQTILGVLLMLLSGLLYSWLTTLVKWATILGYSSAEVIVYRSFIQIIIASIQYCIKRRKLQKAEQIKQKQMKIEMISSKQLASIIGNATFGSLATIASFEGAALCPVGDNVSLKSLTAVTTAFAGYILLKEKITVIHYIALVLAMSAAVLITQPPMIFAHVSIHDNFQQYYPGYIISMVAALCQSGVYICIKSAGTVQVVTLILSRGIMSLISGILLIIFYFKEIHPMRHYDDVICISLICVIGYCAQYSLTKGGKLLIVGLSSLLRATDIGWCFLWEIIVFKTMPNYITIIGAVTMFLSVLLVSIEKVNKSRNFNQKIDSQSMANVYTTDVYVANDKSMTSIDGGLRALNIPLIPQSNNLCLN
eukprot:441843_1